MLFSFMYVTSEIVGSDHFSSYMKLIHLIFQLTIKGILLKFCLAKSSNLKLFINKLISL